MYVLKAVGGVAAGRANCSRFASVRPGGKVAQTRELEIGALEWGCVGRAEKTVGPSRHLLVESGQSGGYVKWLSRRLLQ
jgi:hypothetical protein